MISSQGMGMGVGCLFSTMLHRLLMISSQRMGVGEGCCSPVIKCSFASRSQSFYFTFYPL